MKTVIVTGASQGLGLQIANTFVSSGWSVIGTGRSERPKDLHEDVDYYSFDASKSQESAAFWDHVAQNNSEVCLVNNAGGYIGGNLLELSPEDYVSQMNSIYFAAVNMMQGFVKTHAQGRIVNILSNTANHASKGNSAYGSAKAAQKYFFQTLQDELDSKKYPITNLYPTVIASHGPQDNAIDAGELAAFIREIAENDKSYHLSDVIISAI